MNLTILETSRDVGFITSDNPVLWLDPSLMFNDAPVSFFGLNSPLLDILFPMSPNFVIQLTWTDPEKYLSIDAQPQIIDEINKLIVSFSDEFVVMNHDSPRDYWFDEL